MGFSRKLLRIGLIVVAALVVLVIGAGAVFVATFDPNAQKPRIIAAVKQATGRDLTLGGPLRLGFSLQPTIEARDVALSNPPGFSRPDMMKVDRLDIRLALLPLLSGRVDIGQLVLVHPDVLLEMDQQGHPNWRFNPPPAEAAPAPPPSAPSRSGSRMAIGVSDVILTDGVLAYRDDRTGLTKTLAIRSLALHAGAATHATVEATYNGVPVGLAVDAGPLVRLQNPAAKTPWPIRLRAEAVAATLILDGSLTQPALGKGYDASITASVPDLAPLGPLFAPMQLPPLRDVRFAAHLADKGAPVPAISGMTLHVGTTDLADRLAGLRLDSLDLTAPTMDQPMKAQLVAQLGTTPVNASGTFGAPNLLLGAGAADRPFPADVSAQAAGAALTAKGTIAHPRTLTGLELHLTADIADLEAFGRLLHRDLPPLKTVAFRGVLTEAGGSLRQGMALNGLNVTSSAGDLEGTVTAGFGMPRSLTADIRSSRLDLDTLKGGVPSNPSSSDTPPPGSGPQAATPGQVAPSAHPSPTPSGRIFSDQPLPFGLLRTINADVRMAIADLRYDGTDTRALDTHLVVRDGRLALDPFKADLPQGHLEAAAGIDTNQQPTTVALRLQAPGIVVPPLLKALGEPPLLLSGKLEVLADLRGAGDTPHAIASALDGSLGLSMAGGTVDNRVLGSLLGKAVQELNALDLVGKGGTSELRCLAVRLAFQNGIGTFKTLALGSSLATTHGEGSVNLANETLALRLTPQARVGGTTITIPVRVTGPMRAPSVSVDASAGARDNAGTLAGIIIGGLSGNAKQGGDGCAGPLAIARGQAPPVEVPEETPAAAKSEAPAPPSKPKPPDPAALLKQLFR